MRHALILLAAACLTTGCPKKTAEAPAPKEETASSDAALSAEDSGTPAETPAPDGGARAAQEACVDRWLQEHQLDRYGHPQGTMFAGGSPLFNEATGETKDRLEYVFARQPDALKACPATATP
ncbi:hypothetical protein [Cystobacter ferrugineus]|uniref:Lipoprotein n=1 Tax=Cystobacter ferrugineus TaxID=83449 RepID=A0A1L9B9J9_9BACT|nr:hypothetical protein [Cystobacter ferrugineus]OJH38950.1 hypothetical protein BON30_22330 [Cystobacter ferrugineus]